MKVGWKRFKKDVWVLCLCMSPPTLYNCYYKRDLVRKLKQMKKYKELSEQELLEYLNGLHREKFGFYVFQVYENFIQMR